MMPFKNILVSVLLLFVSLAGNASETNHRAIVLLARFKDCDFTLSQDDLRSRADSAALYFNDQFSGKSSFTFEIGPVATLSESMAYYGRNSPSRHDEYIYKAVMESCLSADEYVDFSRFDGIILITAGKSEAEGAGEDHIWPQQSFISEWGASLCLDGKVIDAFAVTTESAGLGTLCHEYGHLFGLQDLYDTDGASSGGIAKALWGSLSLMDSGDKTGPLPVNFSSVELEQLGIGQCEELATGEYTLEPLADKKRYLKASSDKDGEYFLIECRNEEGWDKNVGCGGMLVYHIDRSDNEAGYSYYYKKTLTAAERWKYNQVNCMPAYQCAELIPAKYDATVIRETAFPQNGVTSFSSVTKPAFTYHDGKASRFALTGIRLLENGNVCFTVLEPVTIKSINAFQDAATVCLEMSGCISDIKETVLEWYSADLLCGSVKIGSGDCSTISGLEPDTEYKLIVKVSSGGGDCYATWDHFKTKPYREGSIPYIDMNDGKRIPLRIINLPHMCKMSWTMNGKEIRTESDGYYTISQTGVLKVVAEDKDGNVNVIEKELISR